MTKTAIDLGIEVIKYTFEKLPPEERLRVVADLERLTRRQRWDPLVRKIRSRVAKNPVSLKEINRICAEVRQQLYEKRTKGGN